MHGETDGHLRRLLFDVELSLTIDTNNGSVKLASLA